MDLIDALAMLAYVALGLVAIYANVIAGWLL